MSKFTKALLSTIVAAGSLLSSCSVADEDKGSAMVMYTWSDADFPYIKSVEASYDDVKSWYDHVYPDNNAADNSTSIPRPGYGSSDIPYKLYAKDIPQYATIRYKGFCLPISKGQYTAVCTVSDLSNKPVYIVANYTIDVGGPGTKKYFEVAFNVNNVLDGIDGKNDTAWVFTEHKNNPCRNN